MERRAVLIMIMAILCAASICVMELGTSASQQDGEVLQPEWYTYRTPPGAAESGVESEAQQIGEGETVQDESTIENYYEEPPVVGGDTEWYIPPEALPEGEPFVVPALGYSGGGSDSDFAGSAGGSSQTMSELETLQSIDQSLRLMLEIVKIGLAVAYIWFFVCKPIRYFVF